ncbi:MAG: RluA family pseudouridine synthase [Calditrichaeota bacterium]|nr:RluA family pseudouridine synthase [Calditrichota bacterium]
MPDHELLVDSNSTDIRLDIFLTDFFEKQSRSQIKKLIESQQVLVNKQAVKSGYLLKENDRISITLEQSTSPDSLPMAENIPLDIVFEDEQCIVINKPAGLVVHPGNANQNGTLVNALLYHTQNKIAGMNPLRPGIVHRLDKDTSGLLVCAKTVEAHAHLSAQFSKKTANRVYLAICWHPFVELQGVIETQIGRNPKHAIKQAVLPEGEGKKAVSRYKVIEQYPFLNLVKFKLDSGRTHQIRVHAKYIKHPVFADTLYSGDERQVKSIHLHYQKFAKQLLASMQRQALHAYHLDFEHPVSKQRLSFERPMPDDMQSILEKCQNKSDDYTILEKI